MLLCCLTLFVLSILFVSFYDCLFGYIVMVCLQRAFYFLFVVCIVAYVIFFCFGICLVLFVLLYCGCLCFFVHVCLCVVGV